MKKIGDSKLCKVVKTDFFDDNLDVYIKLVKKPKYICKKCGRVCKDKGNLCKPKAID